MHITPWSHTYKPMFNTAGQLPILAVRRLIGDAHHGLQVASHVRSLAFFWQAQSLRGLTRAILELGMQPAAGHGPNKPPWGQRCRCLPGAVVCAQWDMAGKWDFASFVACGFCSSCPTCNLYMDPLLRRAFFFSECFQDGEVFQLHVLYRNVVQGPFTSPITRTICPRWTVTPKCHRGTFKVQKMRHHLSYWLYSRVVSKSPYPHLKPCTPQTLQPPYTKL